MEEQARDEKLKQFLLGLYREYQSCYQHQEQRLGRYSRRARKTCKRTVRAKALAQTLEGSGGGR